MSTYSAVQSAPPKFPPVTDVVAKGFLFFYIFLTALTLPKPPSLQHYLHYNEKDPAQAFSFLIAKCVAA